ncbi:flavodoxin [Oerskovia turbata]|uniref:Flavodoxin n=1 Tax=Oerskovia turbata TaxID=1713 RepID=A0A4Q1KXI9_9CELL|nr:flavodoxin domain-containing protein [Oerskovia turbata]RXR24748.1 flavodoxin [Oerskovia turbata]RXR35048.1 flavodoxin [Oerskovia turbata]TGJ97114.1 flavodoxin [Actinotalea fermentans ATCC 43279 = JCM 9966 = DSM 3133]
MEAVVIYESIFGNTAAIAHAIAVGLAQSLTVRTVQLPSDSPARDLGAADLVVLGGPTHAFGMSRRTTREEAAHRQGEGHPVEASGLREWLEALPDEADGRSACVFDTRAKSFRYLPGSAAGSASRLAKQKGLRLVDRPRSFYVTDMEGPLAPGELDRATRWGAHLGRLVPLSPQRD